jgi:hypothetical protein
MARLNREGGRREEKHAVRQRTAMDSCMTRLLQEDICAIVKHEKRVPPVSSS